MCLKLLYTWAGLYTIHSRKKESQEEQERHKKKKWELVWLPEIAEEKSMGTYYKKEEEGGG